MQIPARIGLILALVCCACSSQGAGRIALSLNGRWQIADGKSATAFPSEFTHTVPVPGLADLAEPPFAQVDGFLSREHLAKLISENKAPAEWMTNYWNGKVEQNRNYFWYRTTFRAPKTRAVATLKINKAQFGTAVWLNGTKVGEYAGCFSAGIFDLSQAIRWNAENMLLIRVGAHPAVLPADFPTGSDFEKIKWTPGIYDEVSVWFCDNPEIETVQIAPRIATGEIVVQTRLRNHTDTTCQTSLGYQIKAWKGRRPIATAPAETLSLQPGEEKVLTRTIRVPRAHLWSPEDPFLYVLESRTGGDARFGLALACASSVLMPPPNGPT